MTSPRRRKKRRLKLMVKHLIRSLKKSGGQIGRIEGIKFIEVETTQER